MFELFSSPLGIYWSDNGIAAAVVKGPKLVAHAEAPSKEALPDMLKKLGNHSKKAHVCVPISWVYGTSMKVEGTKKPSKEDIRSALQKSIPEEAENVEFQWSVIEREETSTTVAVLAMRKDRIESIRDTLKKEGITVARITTLPLSVAGAEKGVKFVQSMVEPKSLSLFVDGWLVDEATIPEGIESDAMNSTAEDMQTAYGKKATSTIVIGNTSDPKATKVLTWLHGKSNAVIGAAAAASAPTKVTSF